MVNNLLRQMRSLDVTENYGHSAAQGTRIYLVFYRQRVG